MAHRQEEDDLYDLMEDLHFAGFGDDEVVKFEEDLGTTEDEAEEEPARRGSFGVSSGSHITNSYALAANIQSKKSLGGAGSPLQSARNRYEGHVPPPPAPPSLATFPTAQQLAQQQGSMAPQVSPAVPVKSKRGRKKKEETLARLAAAAAAANANGDGAASSLDGSHRPMFETEEEKERLRRESNKQSARNSRKKKKEYVIVLSEYIGGLTKEVQQLRQDLARKAAEEDHRERLSCLGRNAFLQALDEYGPMSHKRRLSAAYQFENLTRNVAAPHTRFLLWSVARRASEPESAAARTWQQVTTEMGLQPEQQERLSTLLKSKKATDHAAVDEREKLQFVFGAIQKLRFNMEQLSGRMDAYHRGLLDILTPVQQALLYQYIDELKLEEKADAITGQFAFEGLSETELSSDANRLKQIVTGPVGHLGNARASSQVEEMNAVDFLLSLK